MNRCCGEYTTEIVCGVCGRYINPLPWDEPPEPIRGTPEPAAEAKEPRWQSQT